MKGMHSVKSPPLRPPRVGHNARCAVHRQALFHLNLLFDVGTTFFAPDPAHARPSQSPPKTPKWCAPNSVPRRLRSCYRWE